jgi:hypothetical protein
MNVCVAKKGRVEASYEVSNSRTVGKYIASLQTGNRGWRRKGFLIHGHHGILDDPRQMPKSAT